jgi:hypothetical protein
MTCAQVVVTDGARIRRITRSYSNISLIQGIESYNRVVTIAGSTVQGNEDGNQTEAMFTDPRVPIAAFPTLPRLFAVLWGVSSSRDLCL